MVSSKEKNCECDRQIKGVSAFFFFPAFSGLTAGVGLPGDLKNPKKINTPLERYLPRVKTEYMMLALLNHDSDCKRITNKHNLTEVRFRNALLECNNSNQKSKLNTDTYERLSLLKSATILDICKQKYGFVNPSTSSILLSTRVAIATNRAPKIAEAHF